ncbi:TonB-dependent receptor [Sphingopyxis flava]|uniref:Iron complex outermembrane recepter protein n=1 Tax=Sphingopyxis flava TaxID=1507287 RepID=A0A1T5GJK9_9SPHN|nr:TonB-dependent receptor [Sphingopyxis flava]SKC08595.1 iron complex outermembrane recepter protein [Sphingopyxis flava]
MREVFKAVLLGGIAMPASVVAQTAPPVARDVSEPTFGAIIVTAQKRAENLQDVPIAITAITAQELETKGINTLTDFVTSPPPGVQVQPFGGAGQALTIDMRGISNVDPTQGTAELGVAIYLDDVYLGRAQGLGTEIADPERIEVLRGPQGTLFGRNAEGGAIRIVSSKPTGEFGGRVKAGLGNFGDRRYEAHVNLPELAGFAIKVDYLKAKHNGYTKNGPPLPGLARQDDFAAVDNEGGRVSVRWRPIDGAIIDYAYDHATASSTADWRVLVNPDDPSPSYVVPSTFLNGARPTESYRRRTDRAYSTIFVEPLVSRTRGHTLTAQYDLADSLTVKSISAWRKLHSAGTISLGGSASLIPFNVLAGQLKPDPRFGTLGTIGPDTRITALTGVGAFNIIEQRQFSQELQLLGDTDGLKWVIGGYFFREKVRDVRETFYNGVFADSGADGVYTDFIATNPYSLPFPGQGPNDQTSKSRSYAAFAQATWTPAFAGDKLHITPGVRYTNDTKSAVRTIAAGQPITPLVSDFKEERIDPALTVAYEITPDINAYVRYAQAYRAGGTSVRDPAFRPFGSEVNRTYEIGLKSALFDRRAILNIAAFRNTVTDRQLSVILDPATPSLTTTINAPGKSIVKGLEAELSVNPARGVTLVATYSYLEGRLPDILRTIDPGAAFYINNLPKHSGTLAADYLSPDLGGPRFAAHADWTWSSSFDAVSRIANNAYGEPMKRDFANVRIAMQDIPLGSTKLTIAGWMKNVFDVIYPVYSSPNSSAALSPPRTYGIEATVRF